MNSDVTVLNPEHHIATLILMCLNMEITVERGRGYVSAEKNKRKTMQLVLFVDSIFTPVRLTTKLRILGWSQLTMISLA